MKQRGGVIFKNIITMQNKNQFIGYPVKIIRLDDFDQESASDPIYRPYMPGGSDLHGQHPLTELVKEPGFVAQDDPQDVATFFPSGTAFVDVYYPNLDETLPISIPHNLNELAYREGDRNIFNFYLEVFNKPVGRLSRLKSGDFFTTENIKKKNKQSLKRKYQKKALTDPSFQSAEVRVPPLKPIELPEEILHKIAENIKAQKKPHTKRKKRKKNTKRKRKKR